MFTAKVHGLPDLRAAMQKLKLQLQRTVVRKALRSAAMVIRTEAKAQAPVRNIAASAKRKAPYRKPGALRKAIGIVNINPRHLPAGTIGVSVKVRAGRAAMGRGAMFRKDPSFYGYFQEFGTKFMQARPFMGPAAKKLGQALEVFKATLQMEIERINGGK